MEEAREMKTPTLEEYDESKKEKSIAERFGYCIGVLEGSLPAIGDGAVRQNISIVITNLRELSWGMNKKKEGLDEKESALDA